MIFCSFSIRSKRRSFKRKWEKMGENGRQDRTLMVQGVDT